MKRRRGFVLIFALWTLVAGSAVAVATAASARQFINEVGNREARIRVSWLAEGCANQIRARIEELVWPDDATASSVQRSWAMLDSTLAQDFVRVPCAWSIEPAGIRFNANNPDEDAVRRFFRTATGASGDSLADALLDWRDADVTTRPLGAERRWYLSHDLLPPSDSDFSSDGAIARVRGMVARPALLRLMTARDERVLWPRAPLPVIASLPGMTDEALSVFSSHRFAGLTALEALGSYPELSEAARQTFNRSAKDLIPLITDHPDAWILVVSMRVGGTGPAASVEDRFTLTAQNKLSVERSVR